MTQLKVLGFFEGKSWQNPELESRFKQSQIALQVVPSSGNSLTCFLQKTLEDADPSLKVLILPDINKLYDMAGLEHVEQRLKPWDDQILFAASSSLKLNAPDLFYFYWKHYPRPDNRYNFLDSSIFAGKAGILRSFLKDLQERYPDEMSSYSAQDLFNRYYFDCINGCFQAPVRLSLDHEQELFANARLSARKKLVKGWMYEMLYAKNEQSAYAKAGKLSALKYPQNVIKKGRLFFHVHTKTHPLFIVSDQPRADDPVETSFILNMKARVRTLQQLFHINRINKWHTRKEKIFRYSTNKSTEVTEATERLVKRLEKKLPVSFAHYNDGELTFIRDFLKERDHEKWFGRKQQQYNPLLAERLCEAMQFRKEGYFVGVPCSIHHPSLRKLADELVGDYAYKVPAMTIHHNLAYAPRILFALRKREVFFFTNEYQDLSFFDKSGIKVDPAKVFKVPFRNSYLEYERFCDMTFPKEAVVVLTCGMLAKILTKAWYQNHENLSVLALGSSLDDHIQKKNIEFKLYPEDTPLTKNLYKSRSFLFGYKTPCRECYSY